MDLNLKWCWNLLAEGAILFWNCIEGLFQTITTALFSNRYFKGNAQSQACFEYVFSTGYYNPHLYQIDQACSQRYQCIFIHLCRQLSKYSEREREFTHSLHRLHSLHSNAYNYTTSVICLHLPYICPITHICFQHLPSLLCIDCTD